MTEYFINKAIEENPVMVEKFRNGESNVLQFLVGQVLRFSKGKVNPQVASQMLRKKLEDQF